MPQNGVPGERLSKTQPFPTKPAPYERQGSTEENLIDFTPELRAEAVKILNEFDHGPLFTPPTERGTINLPGWAGGANWWGAAFDPETSLFYVPSITAPIVVKLNKPDEARSNFHYVRGGPAFGGAGCGGPAFGGPACGGAACGGPAFGGAACGGPALGATADGGAVAFPTAATDRASRGRTCTALRRTPAAGCLSAATATAVAAALWPSRPPNPWIVHRAWMAPTLRPSASTPGSRASSNRAGRTSAWPRSTRTPEPSLFWTK